VTPGRCDVNALDTVKSKITPLMEAVRKEDIVVCDLLLERGARMDLVDSSGENAVHWAAR
jgi:ankyrin repeat protein